MIDWAISEAPSAVAVTVKLKGASTVLEVDVSVTVRAGTPLEPGLTWPGASVIDDWLSEPVTPAGRPERLRS